MEVVCHIPLESSRQGLHPQSEVCTQNYGFPKSQEFQFWEFQDSHLGVLRQNDIWVVALWPSIENTIRGKVVASPKSKSWWILWIRVYLWLIHAPKVFQLHITNLLFGLCRSIWVIDLLVNLPSPRPGTPTRPFAPEVLGVRERTPTPSFLHS
jgi:hypothetical protein